MDPCGVTQASKGGPMACASESRTPVRRHQPSAHAHRALRPLHVVALHWAHRFRYTLSDGLQIKHLNEVINLLCYSGAIVAAYLLLAVL
jgi:hypothetical protein